MSRLGPRDPLPALGELAAALAAPGQPAPGFAALDRTLDQVLGHRLFTLLRHHPDSGESERLYSSRPEAYPVGGRKPLNPTFWTEQVLRRGEAYLGRTPADVEAVFFDHALIASLGCGSVLNLPLVFDGHTLGTVNLLHEEAWYDEADIPVGRLFAALALPLFLAS